MKKKVKYKLTKQRYIYVEVETPEAEELIKAMNTDLERIEKADQRFIARTVSLDAMKEKYGIEIPDLVQMVSVQSNLDEKALAALYAAIDRLSERQREHILMFYFQGKSQVEIAKELGIDESTVSITMKRAHANLRKFLEKNKKLF